MNRNTPAVVNHLGVGFPRPMIAHPHALAALAALGQSTRLEIFRLLMRNEPNGLSAGRIAEYLDCLQNTLSTHLAILARAHLVKATRSGKAIIYRADVDGMNALMTFLVTDCCGGHPELCGLSGEPRSVSPCEAGGTRRVRSTRALPVKRKS